MNGNKCHKCYWKESCDEIERCKLYSYDCWKFRDHKNKYDTPNSEPDPNGSSMAIHGGSGK